MANVFGRQVVLPLTNKSGGSVAAGDVVIVDTANDSSFTTTTSAGALTAIGVAQETIANNAVGRVLVEGFAALVNVNASVTRGNFGKTHTVAKQATDAGASRIAGTFMRFLTGGTTPAAMLYPVDLAGAALTDPTTTRGDILIRDASALARLAIGGAGTMLGSDGTDPSWVYGRLLAASQYATGTTYSTISTTFADVDATNMKVTFVAPANGKILVRLTAYSDIGAGASAFGRWGLRESTTNVPGAGGSAVRDPVGGVTASVAFLLTGISAGSHTYKWSYKTTNATYAHRILVGTGQDDQPPALMEVFSCP